MSRSRATEGATRVHVGFYLADLFEISAADQTFFADVVITAQWSDPRLAGRGIRSLNLSEVWHPRLQVINQRSVTATLPQRVEIDDSGSVRWQQRWIGRFSARMNLRDFPLDQQRFHIRVVSLGYGVDEVAFVVNSESTQSGRAPDLSITEWSIGLARAEIANFSPAPGAKVLAGAQLSWENRRYIGYQAVQIVFPLVLIVLMGWAAFWLDVSMAPARVSVVMTTMLTLIAYRFALGRSVPNLTYLTRFDYFMLASTFLIFVALMVVAAEARLVSHGRALLASRIDHWVRVAFPVVFGAIFVLAWWG